MSSLRNRTMPALIGLLVEPEQFARMMNWLQENLGFTMEGGAVQDMDSCMKEISLGDGVNQVTFATDEIYHAVDFEWPPDNGKNRYRGDQPCSGERFADMARRGHFYEQK